MQLKLQMWKNTDLHLLENNNLIEKYILKWIFANYWQVQREAAQQHKGHILEQ